MSEAVFQSIADAHYDILFSEPDRFPASAPLHTLDNDQQSKLCITIEQILKAVLNTGMAAKHWSLLSTILYERIDMFCVSCSSASLARPPTNRIELTTNFFPVNCRLRSYLSKQVLFMQDVLTRLYRARSGCRGSVVKYPHCSLLYRKLRNQNFNFMWMYVPQMI